MMYLHIGDLTLGDTKITSVEGHYTSLQCPPNFDVNQIFMTPSIKYCSVGNVYAKRDQ